MWKLFLLMTLVIPMGASARSGLEEEAEMQGYIQEARKDARVLMREYQKLEKPAYKKAYEDYLDDMRVIEETGKAPDNLALYRDLEVMNSEEKYIFSVNKKKIR